MHLLDFAYYAGLGLSSPFWGIPPKARAKVMEALRNRMGHGPENLKAAEGSPSSLAIHLHAVSLGEINATRTLAAELLARRDDVRLVVTSTTQTGLARGLELYKDNPRITVERFPLDFSSAITRFLRRHKPVVSVLMELELWPNFLRLCRKHEVPVVLVNGRLSQHSMQRYKYIKPLAARMMRSLHTLCVQDSVYAERFAAVGAPKDRIVVTGTMKFDTAALSVDPGKVEKLAQETGIDLAHPVLVAGSTGPEEEDILLRCYGEILEEHPTLQLVIVPRKPERFDEVAALIGRAFPLTRRSQPGTTSRDARAVVLGDTMGELRNFYALATVVFVGRTLVDLGPKLHGSDMIEPAALGLPVVVGPYTGNFADAMHLLRTNKAIVEVANDEEELQGAILRLLGSVEERNRLGAAARATVELGKGATSRHADRILNLLPAPVGPS